MAANIKKNDIGTYTTLTSKQKTAISLLSMGTFLEYFDLYLYVHMAVLLNEIFFPKTDPHTAALLTAFAFCSTYVVRPVGALIFGYLGDKYGRKSTLILTTTLMSLSCLAMANLPTYAQIGIAAAYLVTIVRIFQGMASMGEAIGAEIYLTEITKPPIQYPVVSLVALFGVLGGTVALGAASLINDQTFTWRWLFWAGALVAVISGLARKSMYESPEFIQAQQKVNDNEAKKLIYCGKTDKITLLALFCIRCAWPVCFYFAFIYCGNILKQDFDMSTDEVLQQNFIVSLAQLINWFVLVYITYKIDPLKIVKFRLTVFAIFILFTPYLFSLANSADNILYIQIFIVVFGFMDTPALPILYKYLPVMKRYTLGAFAYALSRVMVYVFTSFGVVCLSEFCGQWVFLIAMTPIALAFSLSVRHFDRLEKAQNMSSEAVVVA